MFVILWRPEHGEEHTIPSGTIRITKDLHIHAIDLIQIVCNTNRNYAAQILRRIVAGNQFCVSDITFVVRGNRKTPLVSFNQAFKLMMVLPGVKAKDGRGKFAQVIHAFIAGDPELKTKIDENAESLHWFNVLARESLQADRASAWSDARFWLENRSRQTLSLSRLSRRDRPPQPRPAEDRRRAAHVCAAIGVPPLWRTCTPRAARATRLPSPATAAKGPAPGSTCAFRHQSVATSASRARPVQLTRRDRPPRPRPTEGKCRAAHACTAIGASRSRRDAIAEGRASRLSAASVLPPPARHDRARRARQVLSALCSRPPQQRWWRAAPHGGTECHCRRVAIKRDEHAQCRQCSAVALPSRTGGGQCNMAASGVAAGASRSRETSTPRVVHALQSSSPAVLVEGSIALQHRVPLPARRDSARRARAVSSALCRLSPQPSWRRAVPHGCVRCCNLRFAVARDKHATWRLRSAGALPG